MRTRAALRIVLLWSGFACVAFWIISRLATIQPTQSSSSQPSPTPIATLSATASAPLPEASAGNASSVQPENTEPASATPQSSAPRAVPAYAVLLPLAPSYPTPTPKPTPAPTPTATPTPTRDYNNTKWPDGKLLIHPEHFVNTGVVNVKQNDTLKLRSGPGTKFSSLAEIPADRTDITAFDQDQVWDGDTWWCPVEWHGLRGYVSRHYLPNTH